MFSTSADQLALFPALSVDYRTPLLLWFRDEERGRRCQIKCPPKCSSMSLSERECVHQVKMKESRKEKMDAATRCKPGKLQYTTFMFLCLDTL